jgi:hypothetical protein
MNINVEKIIQRNKAASDAKWALYVAKKQGIKVTEDITLGVTDSDRAAFSQLLVLLREAQELSTDKEAFANSVYPITDVKGASHIVTVTELRNILVTYGMMYQSIWAAANTTI